MVVANQFQPVVSAEKTEPKANANRPGITGLKIMLRDQLTLESWLCLSAVIQGALFLIGGSVTLLPALTLILWRTFSAVAMAQGWIHNTYLDGVITKKTAAVFPDETGEFGSQPSNKDIVVFLIGTRSNHPMGMFAPEFRTMGDYFVGMSKQLDANAEEYGYLGQTSWTNSSDRETSGELMNICYFKDMEGLMKFSHSKLHREAWNWWNKTYNQGNYRGIWHETYRVPAGNWESISINMHLSGLNSTRVPVMDKQTGEKVWMRPVVDASKGALKTGAGRMNKSKGDDQDAFVQDPYNV